MIRCFSKSIALGLLSSLSMLIAGDGKAIFIRNARIHTLEGPIIEKGNLLLRDGRIAAVGEDLSAPSDADAIDASGLDAYPGFFDAGGSLGLMEIPVVRPGVDTNDPGDLNPQLIAATAIHPYSELIPIARVNGVTHALAMPGQGALVGGQASVFVLEGRSIETMALRTRAGLVITWPQIQTRSFDPMTFQPRTKPFTEAKEEQDKKLTQLRDLFERAQRALRAGERVNPDLKFQALFPYLKGEAPVLVRVEKEREIKQVLDFADRFQLKLVLVDPDDALKLKDRLKAKNVAVILGPCLRFSRDEDASYDFHHIQAGALSAAGIKVAFASLGEPSDVRSLPFEGPGNAVSFGLVHEEAIKSLTKNPAEIFGLDDQLGSLKAGKIANLFLVKGDPLDFSSDVKFVFIQGKQVSLENHHTRLYEKFKK
jgi:imidazolonepropionase-like amidohydrolase